MTLALVAAGVGLLAGTLADRAARRRFPDAARGPGRRRSIALGAATAALWVAVAALGERSSAQIALGLLLVTLLVAVVPIDLEHRLILDGMTYPAAVLALALGLALDPGGVPEQLGAACAAGGFLLAAALVAPAGMGLGDAKLAFVMGLCLGRAVAPALLYALIGGALAGLVVVARHGVARGRSATLPFGPFLAAGAVLALLGADDPGGAAP